MKKLFIAIFSLLITHIAIGQGKFAASVSNTGNTLIFKLRATGGNVTTGFSGIEFFLRYPTSTPAFSYGTVVQNSASFPGMTASGGLGTGSWEIERNNAAYILPGFNVDHFIYTAPAPATGSQTYTNGSEYEVIRVPLIGTPPNTVSFQFIHQDSEEKYYLAITSEVGADLRPAAATNYFYPSTTTLSGPSGSTLYLMDLVNVPVPVKFNGFTAVKKEADGLLTWSVENESAITERYEVERSFNGTDFTKIATVAPKNNGFGSNTYTLTDANLAGLRSAGVIYYRIKQTDRDGKFVYSEIRSIRLDGRGFAVGIYPNPVKDVTTVNIDLVEDTDVLISITDAAGKQVKQVQVQGFKGPNARKVDLSGFASGTYVFKVSAGIEQKTISVVKGL